jgi:hypothetical protein
LNFLGLERGGEERLEKLRGVEVEILVKAAQGIGVFSTPPVADEMFLSRGCRITLMKPS